MSVSSYTYVVLGLNYDEVVGVEGEKTKVTRYNEITGEEYETYLIHSVNTYFGIKNEVDPYNFFINLGLKDSPSSVCFGFKVPYYDEGFVGLVLHSGSRDSFFELPIKSLENYKEKAKMMFKEKFNVDIEPRLLVFSYFG